MFKTKNLTIAAFLAVAGFFPSTTTAETPDSNANAESQSAPETTVADEMPQRRLDVSGSFFSRYELRRNYAQAPVLGENPASDLIRYRARLGLGVDVLQTDGLDLAVHFVPQAGGFWHVGGDDLADPALGVHEAFIDIATSTVSFDVGRFEMTYGDHLVIGNVGWHHLGRAFDGARMRTPLGEAWLDVFFTVLDEGFVGDLRVADPFGANDAYFTGAYAGLGPLFSESAELDVYLLSRIWPGSDEGGAAPPADPLVPRRDFAADVTPGARFKGNLGLLDFRAETGLQLGTRPGTASAEARDVVAFQGDLEVGVDLREAAKTRVALEGFYASGDDPGSDELEAYDHLYPTAHKWMGLMDFVGARSNVYGGVAHLLFALSPVTLKIDTHLFFRPVPADDDQYLGTEIDAGVAWAIAKPLKLRGLYGIFIAEEGDPRHFAELAIEANF